MAKKTTNEGGQEARLDTAAPSSAPAPDMDDAPAEEAERVPWRQILLCVKGCTLYLGGSLRRVFGGEWVTDQSDVIAIGHDVEHFTSFDVYAPEEIPATIARHAATLSEARVQLAKLGMVVVGHGSFTPVKR